MFERLQNAVLAMIAVGAPLTAVATRICEEAEKLAPFAICSILTVDSGGRLHPLAAPSLPTAYSECLEGMEIGPRAGSCGTAAHRKEAVVVNDISRDPLWTEFRDLALPLGLKACWSSPIHGNEGRVLATFAFYYRTNRGPSELEKDIVDACVHLCSIALERELARIEINRLAYFDELTGLPNRSSFEQMLEKTGATPFGLLLIDIDRLKHVNDTFGHHAGDDLIRDLGRRIGNNAKPGTAYRIGGDEFAVTVPCDQALGPEAVALQILSAMGSPVLCGGHALASGVTIGGVAVRRDGSSTSALNRIHADMALYHAKEHVRGGLVMYSADLGSSVENRNRSIRDASDALRESRVEAFYQPIVRLDTNEIVGVEALCRLRMRDGLVVAAGAIKEALQDPLIGTRITETMMSQVAADVRSWLDMGIPFQHVGINVSAADFQGQDLEQRIVSAFERQNLPLKHLILEVTESVYTGNSDDAAGRAAKAFRAKGLLVALDDFGTGYASLTHLLQFPVDVIKIDKSFVDHLGTGGTGSVIIKGLIDIAGKLGMRIVAEGIESSEQALELRRLGCCLGQGYLFGRPTDALQMTRALLFHAQPEPARAKRLARASA